MNRVLFALLSVCIGALGARAWQQSASRIDGATFLKDRQWETATGQLASAQSALIALQGQVQDQKHQIEETAPPSTISPELLALVEGRLSKLSLGAWAELRQQLGISWNSSPDYVLVPKRTLEDLDYERLTANPEISNTACDLLAISPAERTALNSVLQADLEQPLKVTFSQPSGDVVAQYTVEPPDPGSLLTVSNSFVSDLTAVVGRERTGLLLPNIWREFRSHLGPLAAETIIVRRTIVDGRPDLTWEASQNDNLTFTEPVRYAHYPRWFLEIFPGGWQTLADRAGFQLPAQWKP